MEQPIEILHCERVICLYCWPWLPAWWALWLLWWPLTDAAMFQCVYGYLQSVFFFLVLFHCCILLEIKLTTTTYWCLESPPSTGFLIIIMGKQLVEYSNYQSPSCVWNLHEWNHSRISQRTTRWIQYALPEDRVNPVYSPRWQGESSILPTNFIGGWGWGVVGCGGVGVWGVWVGDGVGMGVGGGSMISYI